MLGLLVLLALVDAVAGDAIMMAHFARPLTRPRLARLSAELGYDVRPYQHDGTALALFMNDSCAHAMHADVAVASMAPMPRAARLATVGALAWPARVGECAFLDAPAENVSALPPATTVDVLVELHAGACTSAAATSALHETLERRLLALDASWHRASPTTYYVRAVPTTAVDALASALVDTSPAVYRVEPAPAAGLLNLWSGASVQTYPGISHTDVAAADACTTCRPLTAAGLTGAGQAIAVIDTGVDVESIFLRDAAHAVPRTTSATTCPPATGHRRIRCYRDPSGEYVDAVAHGTHVTCIAAGAALVPDAPTTLDAADFNGIAPDAMLYVVDIHAGGPTAPLSLPRPVDERLFGPLVAEGVRIFSCSFGITEYTGYTDDMRRVDRLLYEHDDVLIVAAAGNEYGVRGANSLVSFARSKNTLDVGATENGYAARALLQGPAPAFGAAAYEPSRRAAFSSVGGPAQGSWFGPRVCAPGDVVISGVPSGGAADDAPVGAHVGALSGTSQSTPAVSGAAAAVRQFFVERRGFTPRGPLLAATLAASARPLVGTYPDAPLPGAVAPYYAMYAQGYGRIDVAWILDSIVVLANGDVPFTASGEVHRFCVHLAGTAPAAHVVVALTYYDPEGPTLVNDLDVEARGTDGGALGRPNNRTTADADSPYERLDFAAPANGRLEIVVRARTLRFGVQRYALLLAAESPRPIAVTVNGAPAPANPAAIVVDHAATGSCVTCGGAFEPACAVCGNGVVEGDEQCDDATAPCCNALTCRFHADARACTRVVEACALSGVCAAGSAACTVTDASCAPAPTPPTLPPASSDVCALSVDAVMRALPAAYVLDGVDDICCTPPAAFAAAYVGDAPSLFDPRFSALARAVIAARVNVRRGVVLTPAVFARIAAAEDALAVACDGGFVHRPAARRTAYFLLDDLETVNAGTCALTGPRDAPAPACGGLTADAAYCSAAGTYDVVDDSCRCEPGRAGDACERRACSERGLFADGACTCVAGWGGAACDVCAPSPVAGTTYLCLGLVASRTPPSVVDTHVLAPVADASVAARLAGAYADTDKPADARPGTTGLDCACARMPPTSAADALAADARRGDLLALAAPRLASVVPTTIVTPVTSGASRLRVW